MKSSPLRTDLPAVPGGADASLAAAWRFFGAGDPDALPAVEAAWQQAGEGHRELRAEIAATAILFVEYIFITLRDLPRWAERLEAVRPHAGATASARLLAAAAVAILEYRGVRAAARGRAPIDDWVALLRQDVASDGAILAASALMLNAGAFSDEAGFARLEAASGHKLADAAPYCRFCWYGTRAQRSFQSLRYDEAEAMLDAGVAAMGSLPEPSPDVERARGPAWIVARLHTVLRAEIALGRGDLAAAAGLLAPLGDTDLARPDAVMAFVEILRARAAALQGRYEAAKRHARLANAMGDEAAFDVRPMTLQVEAQAMVAIGEGREAGELLGRAAASLIGASRDNAALASSLCRGYAALRAGDLAAAQDEFARTLPEFRRIENTAFLRYVPDVAAEVLAAALRMGIEPDWVRHVIRERGLAAPERAPATWPWPVRIRALGPFALDVDRATADLSGRGRLLEALMAIIALGGRRVRVDEVIAAVWRGRGRVGTDNVWHVTMRRLRDVLTRDDAIVLAQQRISLAAGVVDLDLWRLEAALEAASADPADPAAADAVAAAYRGPLLEGSVQPVVASARDRLRGRLAAFATEAKLHLPAAKAAALGRQLLRVDPLLPLA